MEIVPKTRRDEDCLLSTSFAGRVVFCLASIADEREQRATTIVSVFQELTIISLVVEWFVLFSF